MTVNQILIGVEAERVRHGFSIPKLCERAGCLSSRLYNYWMSGELSPRLSVLIGVCDALGLELTIKERDENAAD